MAEALFEEGELETLVSKLVADSKTPGASAAVQREDALSTGAAGFVNLKTKVETTPDAIFQIGSNTKVYNATLVMQLVDAGLVGLDQPVIEVLPEFKLADEEATGQMTLRRLLTHTSGIDGGDYIEDYGRGEDALQRYVASLADVGLVHPIGRFNSYCNAATVVAGRVVEVLTGLTWIEALRQRIVSPLGLEETVTLPEEAVLYRVAAGHVADPEGGEQPVPTRDWTLPFACAPAGAVINASARDLCAFGQFHIRNGLAPDGTRLLSEESALAMREPQYVDASEGVRRQGIGWGLSKQGDVEFALHGGGTIGQVSQFLIVPSAKVSVAVLTNGPGGGAVIAGVLKEVFSRLGVEVGSPTAGDPQAGATADKALAAEAPVDVDLNLYAGTYARKGLITEVEVGDEGTLIATVRHEGYLERLPPVPPMTLKPLTAERFSMLDKEGKPAGQVRFDDLDEQGRPTYFILGRVSKRVA
jgi:CubicO group peptidase (beta-lactamase class C family)